MLVNTHISDVTLISLNANKVLLSDVTVCVISVMKSSANIFEPLFLPLDW